MGKLLPVLLLAGAAVAAAVVTVFLTEEKSKKNGEDAEEGTPVRREKASPTECISIDYDSFDNAVDLELIKNELTKHFEETGNDIVRDSCTVVFDEDTDGPYFDSSESGCRIALTNKDALYWCQQIYQLAQAMTAYMIYEHNSDDEAQISWAEEAICLSIALYFFDYFEKNWANTSLGRRSPEYVSTLSQYKTDRIAKNDGAPDSVGELARLYSLIRPEDISGLLSCRDYADGIFLDSEAYKESFPGNKAVEYLCTLSDKRRQEMQ